MADRPDFIQRNFPPPNSLARQLTDRAARSPADNAVSAPPILSPFPSAATSPPPVIVGLPPAAPSATHGGSTSARPVTQAEVDLAFGQKLEATKTAALVGIAPAALAVGTGIEVLRAGKLGIHVSGMEPRPPGSRTAVRPTKAAFTFLLPAPVGVVPPEVFGASPDVPQRLLPDFLALEQLGTKTTPERLAVFQAHSRSVEITREVTLIQLGQLPIFPARLRSDLLFVELTAPDTRPTQEVIDALRQLVAGLDAAPPAAQPGAAPAARPGAAPAEAISNAIGSALASPPAGDNRKPPDNARARANADAGGTFVRDTLQLFGDP